MDPDEERDPLQRAAAALERIADVLEQVAPASTNGQGDVVARAFEVAAALRADGT